MLSASAALILFLPPLYIHSLSARHHLLDSFFLSWPLCLCPTPFISVCLGILAFLTFALLIFLLAFSSVSLLQSDVSQITVRLKMGVLTAAHRCCQASVAFMKSSVHTPLSFVVWSPDWDSTTPEYSSSRSGFRTYCNYTFSTRVRFILNVKGQKKDCIFASEQICSVCVFFLLLCCVALLDMSIQGMIKFLLF